MRSHKTSKEDYAKRLAAGEAEQRRFLRYVQGVGEEGYMQKDHMQSVAGKVVRVPDVVITKGRCGARWVEVKQEATLSRNFKRGVTGFSIRGDKWEDYLWVSQHTHPVWVALVVLSDKVPDSDLMQAKRLGVMPPRVHSSGVFSRELLYLDDRKRVEETKEGPMLWFDIEDFNFNAPINSYIQKAGD